MAKTESKMLSLGTVAPDFYLKDVVSGQKVGLYRSKPAMGVVIMFICNHCPYVKHTMHGIIQLALDYKQQGIQFFAINSNDIMQYPDDAPTVMKQIAQETAYPFPYLFDATQEVAKAYQAACTPDFYVFDRQFKLVYRGQFDDARPGNGIPATGASIREALEALLHQQPMPTRQKPSLGCNIKWKI